MYFKIFHIQKCIINIPSEDFFFSFAFPVYSEISYSSEDVNINREKEKKMKQRIRKWNIDRVRCLFDSECTE